MLHLALLPCVAVTPFALHELPAQPHASLREAAVESIYRVEPLGADGAWQASNPAQALRGTFTDEGLALAGTDESRRSWSLQLSLSASGRDGALSPVESAAPVATDRRVEYRRGAITEWYLNDEQGLEQGFTVEVAPPGDGPLRLSLSSDAGLSAELLPGGRGAHFRDHAGDVVLSYTGLKAWDASQRELDAHLALEDGALAIRVDDENAVYPVQIDPWFQEVKLFAGDAAASDGLGFSMEISGDTAVVGASADDNAGGVNAGAAYVFVHGASGWSEQQKLTASDAAPVDLFGRALAIDGDTIVVGVRHADLAVGVDAGAAYVFVRSGTTWTEQQKLVASDAAANDLFGNAVGVFGDTVVVGAPQEDNAGGSNSGAAYVFVRSGSVWSQQQKLEPSDGAVNDFFGNYAALDGDTAVIAANGKTIAGSGFSGAAYVWVRSGAVWSQQQQLFSGNPIHGENFGSAVAIDGDTALVGASADTHAVATAGAAYVFVRSGTIWSPQAKLTASDAATNDRFGAAVALSGDVAAVGAYFKTIPAGAAAGAAYVYARSAASWSEQQRLVASDAAFGDNFGWAIGVEGSRVLVGSPGADHAAGAGAGAAYVFVLVPPPTTYCTAGTTTNGCNAQMGFSGIASASAASAFTLLATSVEGQKQGLIFYGVSGPNAAPWSPGSGSTSYFCVKTPVQRTPAASSGGTAGSCDGLFALDWNAYQASHAGALGQPLQVLQPFWAQAWFRDPSAPATTNLSNAIAFSLAP